MIPVAPRPTVVFDLDGTLVDSQTDIVNSFLHAFHEVGASVPAREAVVSLIGKPLEDMYAALAPAQLVGRLADAYRQHYPQHFTDTTAPYAGVPELLEELGQRGYARAVATTKRSSMAHALVKAVGLAPLLDHVQGTDDLPPKPAPDVLYAAVRAVGGVGLVMVGDSVVDVRAGLAAGFLTYAVTWGTGTAADLAAAGAHHVQADLNALLPLLDSLGT
ncbi:MAG: HAD-IA family hydrolase [Trueperaceae bacterium]